MYLLLTFFVLLIQLQQSENRYCQQAVDSVKIVPSCPTSKKEWDKAAQKKNCISIATLQKCSSVEQFVYHCVMNGYRNETLEVCAPSRIIFGHCVEFNVPGGVIQDQVSAACNETFPKCDASYLSSTAYKYPDCYKLVSMSTTKSTIATNSDESKISKSMIALYFTSAGLWLATLSVMIYKICFEKKNPQKTESSRTITASNNNESNQEVPGSSESDLNSDFRIDMESEDIKPLLQQNSSCSQSHTKPLELEICETNPDQVDSHPANLPADDKDSLHDLETDGPSGNFSRRIRFDRQWSYPFDEKNKRDYHGVMQKDQPLTAIDQVSKDDESVGSTETSSILELSDKQLNRISKYLAVNNLFTDVARDFGMEEEDIQAVKINYGKENSIKETAYQMLLQIKKKRGKITLQELKSSLQNHDLGAWEKVHKVLHQTSS